MQLCFAPAVAFRVMSQSIVQLLAPMTTNYGGKLKGCLALAVRLFLRPFRFTCSPVCSARTSFFCERVLFLRDACVNIYVQLLSPALVSATSRCKESTSTTHHSLKVLCVRQISGSSYGVACFQLSLHRMAACVVYIYVYVYAYLYIYNDIRHPKQQGLMCWCQDFLSQDVYGKSLEALSHKPRQRYVRGNCGDFR